MFGPIVKLSFAVAVAWLKLPVARGRPSQVGIFSSSLFPRRPSQSVLMKKKKKKKK